MKTTKNEEPNLKAAPPYKNHVSLVGYLGDKPEERSGHAVLSLATKTSWKPKDSEEWKERTEWHRIVAWGQLAEAVKPLAKGDHVLVEGELRSNEYEATVDVIGGGTANRKPPDVGNPGTARAQARAQKTGAAQGKGKSCLARFAPALERESGFLRSKRTSTRKNFSWKTPTKLFTT